MATRHSTAARSTPKAKPLCRPPRLVAVVSEPATFSEEALDTTDNALARIQSRVGTAIALANAIEVLTAFGPSLWLELVPRGATVNDNTVIELVQHLGDLLSKIDDDREIIDQALRDPGETKEAANG